MADTQCVSMILLEYKTYDNSVVTKVTYIDKYGRSISKLFIKPVLKDHEYNARNILYNSIKLNYRNRKDIVIREVQFDPDIDKIATKCGRVHTEYSQIL